MATIAIIGGGAAGIAAAHTLLSSQHEVILIEAAPVLGGDCFGINRRLPNGSICAVDAGVSDFNANTFTQLRRLLDELDLRYYPISQDASFMKPDGTTLWYSKEGEPKFRIPMANEELFRKEIARFRDEASEVLDDEEFATWTTRRYLDHRGYSEDFWRLYLEPRAIGCFPMPDEWAGDYPIRSLVSFWRMHGIVGNEPSTRMVIEGGMHQYCRRFERHFVEKGGRLYCATSVVGVARRRNHIEVRAKTSEDLHLLFTVDHVIFATNSNEVLPLIENPTDSEKNYFGQFPYQRAVLWVHDDPLLMPDEREAWGAYNYVVPEGEVPEVRPIMNFYPNKLARLAPEVPDVFVTMNPHRRPRPEHVIAMRFFEHPVACQRSQEYSRNIDAIQGENRTWFAGSYLIEPFVHEQAIQSGISAASHVLDALAPVTLGRPWKISAVAL